MFCSRSSENNLVDVIINITGVLSCHTVWAGVKTKNFGKLGRALSCFIQSTMFNIQRTLFTHKLPVLPITAGISFRHH